MSPHPRPQNLLILFLVWSLAQMPISARPVPAPTPVPAPESNDSQGKSKAAQALAIVGAALAGAGCVVALAQGKIEEGLKQCAQAAQSAAGAGQNGDRGKKVAMGDLGKFGLPDLSPVTDPDARSIEEARAAGSDADRPAVALTDTSEALLSKTAEPGEGASPDEGPHPREESELTLVTTADPKTTTSIPTIAPAPSASHVGTETASVGYSTHPGLRLTRIAITAEQFQGLHTAARTGWRAAPLARGGNRTDASGAASAVSGPEQETVRSSTADFLASLMGPRQTGADRAAAHNAEIFVPLPRPGSPAPNIFQYASWRLRHEAKIRRKSVLVRADGQVPGRGGGIDGIL